MFGAWERVGWGQASPLAAPGRSGCGEEDFSLCISVKPPASWGRGKGFDHQQVMTQVWGCHPSTQNGGPRPQHCHLLWSWRCFQGEAPPCLEWLVGSIRDCPILQSQDFSYAGGPWPGHLSRHGFVSLSIFPGYPVENFSTTCHCPAVLEPEGLRKHWESSRDDSRSSLPCSLQSCLRRQSSNRTRHQGEVKQTIEEVASLLLAHTEGTPGKRVSEGHTGSFWFWSARPVLARWVFISKNVDQVVSSPFPQHMDDLWYVWASGCSSGPGVKPLA